MKEKSNIFAPKTKWTKKYKLGTVDGEVIYLSAPSWDCGWYWGFGYLGNNNRHYHLHGLSERKNQNLYDAIKEHFGSSLVINEERGNDLFKFCELVLTAYTLKETAEVLGRGGSHMTTNPCAELIKNPVEVGRINEILLPAIFNEIADLWDKTGQ